MLRLSSLFSTSISPSTLLMSSGRREWSNGGGGSGSGKRQREFSQNDGTQKKRAEYDQRRDQDAGRVRSEVRGRDNGLDRKTLNIDPAAALNGVSQKELQSRCVIADCAVMLPRLTSLCLIARG
jgi:hypothetical protein